MLVLTYCKSALINGEDELTVDGQQVTLVMPCRNEASHLANLIKEIPSFYDEVICVSNNSTDKTYEIGKHLESVYPYFHMLRDDRTASGIGYGYAHMSGIEAAKSEIIVCADADSTYPIEDAAAPIHMLSKHKSLKFISCTRYPDSAIPFSLQLGVKVLNWEIRMLYGLKINDSLSGMWVFPKASLAQLNLTMGDWNLSPEIKIKAFEAFREGFKEVKITQHPRSGVTKQHYLRTGLSHLIWIAKNRFHPSSAIQGTDSLDYNP